MTLSAQLDEEEPCTLMRQRIPNNLDSLAIPLNELVAVRDVQGRADALSSRQQESWGTLGIRVEWSFLTLDRQIVNGDVIRLPPDEYFPQRYLRIIGTAETFRRKGNIDDHVEYPAAEMRVT